MSVEHSTSDPRSSGEKHDEPEVSVPAALIEDIHYHLSRYDEATSRALAAQHLVELWNKVGDLTTWHPGYANGTLPWQRDDEDESSLPSACQDGDE